MPTEDLGLFAFRMDRYRAKYAERLAQHARPRPRALLAEIADARPARRERDRAGAERAAGAVVGLVRHEADARAAVRARATWSAPGRRGFERRYGLPEQVLGGPIDAGAEGGGDPRARAPGGGRARRRGAAGPRRLLPPPLRRHRGRPRAELEEAGELVPVAVPGWERADGRPLKAWRHVDAAPPARLQGRRAAVAVRPGRVAAGPDRCGCSASTTGSRSTRRRRSGCTATTCCPCSSTTGSSAGST